MLRLDAVDGDVGGQREHHHLHHREQRDRHAQQQRARFARAPAPRARRGIVRMRAIADRGDGAQHAPTAATRRRVPDDARAPRREVDARRRDARAAARATIRSSQTQAPQVNAFDEQRHFARAVGRRCTNPAAGRGVVPVRPLVARRGRRAARRSPCARVESVEAGSADRLRDGEAAGAAERAATRPRPVANHRDDAGFGRPQW